MHILDIAENSIRAGANKIAIKIQEDEGNDLLIICIKDNGEGMDGDTLKRILDPFFTTKTGKRVGLGLALLSQASDQAGGKLTVDSKKGLGTKITAVFKQSHPDMKPMGDMLETMAVLITGHPEIRFIYEHKRGNETHRFDSFKNQIS